MKPAFTIIIVLSIFSLAGCATISGEYEQASKINTIDSYKAFLEKYPHSPYTNKANNKIAELRKLERDKKRLEKINKNWDKLRKGMSVDEVDSLVGPLNRTAVISIKKLAENKNATGGFPYRGHFFTLIFDSEGKLSDWSFE